MLTKRGKACLILIFSVNTNCESMAYRSFRSEKHSARGVRKVTTGITLFVVYLERVRIGTFLALVGAQGHSHEFAASKPAEPPTPSFFETTVGFTVLWQPRDRDTSSLSPAMREADMLQGRSRDHVLGSLQACASLPCSL